MIAFQYSSEIHWAFLCKFRLSVYSNLSAFHLFADIFYNYLCNVTRTFALYIEEQKGSELNHAHKNTLKTAARSRVQRCRKLQKDLKDSISPSSRYQQREKTILKLKKDSKMKISFSREKWMEMIWDWTCCA